MKPSIALILLTIFLNPLLSFCKTLIITHPEIYWDPSATAGVASRNLLLDQSFKNKIVIYSFKKNPVSKKPYYFTFPIKDLQFLPIYSDDGRIKYRHTEQDVYVAGGYWGACLGNTIISLIDNSSPNLDLRIHVMMKATFAADARMPDSQVSIGLDNNGGVYAATLETVYQRNSDLFLKDYV